MNLPCKWEVLFISLLIQVCFMSGIHYKNGTVTLSREDVLLLKDEQDPKCFTRTGEDFTCFFETSENRTYDLLYKVGRYEGRCHMSVEGTEEGTFLHVCSFPYTDVYIFVETPLVVVDNTNTSLYKRTVSVEDHFLLDPPFNVSIHQTGRRGELQVSWHTKVTTDCGTAMHRIRYSSKGLGERTEEVQSGLLDTLAPGEEVKVQVAVKCAFNSDTGHWSSWSRPVQARAPQSADDVSLICYTMDLQNITCQWNGSRYAVENEYKLFYKMMGFSNSSHWTEWTECLTNGSSMNLCRFHGKESKTLKVKLSSIPAPLSRTFFSQEFTLQNSIKTSPPGRLRGAVENSKLCLKWDAPLQPLSQDLLYEISYQSSRGKAWMTSSVTGPETEACLDISTGTQYRVKIRAKPHGHSYSGYWSDWSDVLAANTPADIGLLLMLCVPVLMLTTVIIFMCLFYKYLSKLKQYFWPPVPNLDKVLQGFLTEINRPSWDPPLAAKQCSEETISSLVEIMSENKVSELRESILLLSTEGSFSSRELADQTETFPDYVTLNKDSVFIYPKGNKYQEVKGESPQTRHCCCTDGLVCVPPCLGTDFLNHSYLPLAECADTLECQVTGVRGPGNLYTNFLHS
uniref:MPL proto-oncogene, thrombopoietin receptor n=1 Tax=Mastacembelus armatus TaxID=205130 RepID=A0A7N8X7C5_9TELE